MQTRPGPTLAAPKSQQKMTKTLLENEDAAEVPKKGTRLDFLPKSAQKAPKMESKIMRRNSPFQLLNQVCKKSLYGMTPRLTFGLDLGPF